LRVALKLAYLGDRYHGFQVQPDVPTIEGTLFKALKKLGIVNNPKKANYSASGRTDRGVHALEQVVAFNTTSNLVTPRIINNELPDDIWVWARAKVSGTFDPRRKAISREYRYILYGKGLEISKMRHASELLLGTHDFANFATMDEDKSTKRTVKRIEIRVVGPFIILDIVANSFAQHMVRKIITGLSMVGAGARDEEWLRNMLEPGKYKEGIEPAPPFGLILRKVNYTGILFREEEYAKARARRELQDKRLFYGTMAEVLKDMRDAMGR